jgi:hypothetical protein
LPTVVVAAHPIKNASEDNLLPYGSGAILNEVDGNLTLWKQSATGFAILHWQGKLRRLEFDPVTFRFEETSSPDLLDAKGRQFMLPTMRPVSREAAEQRDKTESNSEIALLRAIASDPEATQAEWGRVIGRTKGPVNTKLQKLQKLKFVEEGLGGKWKLTPKGQKEISP